MLRFLRAYSFAFILCTFLSAVAGSHLAAQTQPPQVSVVILPGSQLNAGTVNDPLTTDGFRLLLSVDEPPQNYALAGWSFQNSGAVFCPGGSSLFFGAEGPTPNFTHRRVQSGQLRTTINVAIVVPAFDPANPIIASITVFTDPHPDGCSTGGGGGPPPPPGDTGPTNILLNVDSGPFPLGATVPLSASARDSDTDTLTFRVFVSSVATPSVRGSLILARQVAGCQSSCSTSLNYQLPGVPGTSYLLVEVSDGQTTRSSSKSPVVASLTGQPPPTQASPVTCNCPNPSQQIQLDAGPTMVQILGGDSLSLMATSGSSLNGSTAVPIASRMWSVSNSGGLGNGQFNFANASADSTSVTTPDVSQDTTVELTYSATFSNCTCQDTIDVLLLADAPQEADLSITQSGPSAIVVGSEADFQIQVANAGPGTATSTTIFHSITGPGTITGATSSSGTCSVQSQQASCAVGDIPNGGSASATFTVRADSEGTINAAASVSSSQVGDPSFANNTDSDSANALVTQADLSISMTDSQDPVPQGGSFDYSMTVTNSGPEQATGVTLLDSVPAGLTFLQAIASQGTCSNAGNVVQCDLGTLDVDASAAVTIQVQGGAPGSFNNTASVSADQGEPTPADNSASESTTVTDAEADLQIEVVGDPNPVGQDRPLTFTITVTNNGPDPATGVRIVDELPEGADFQGSQTSGSGTCFEAAGTVTCAMGDLDVGESAFAAIMVVASGDGLISNTATVSGDQVDSDDTNNSSTSEVRILSSNFVVVPNLLSIPETFIGLAIVNGIGGENTINLQGLDESGQVMDELSLASPISPLGQTAFLTRQPEPGINDSPLSGVSLVARGENGPVQGFFLMGRDILNSLDGIGNRLEDDTALFLPRVRQIGGDLTMIFIFNAQLELTANVEMELFDPAGNSLATSTSELQPSGAILSTVDEIFGRNDLEDGYIAITSSNPVRGFELIVEQDSFATIPAQRGFTTEFLMAPHFFMAGGEQTTLLRVLNLNAQDAEITVRAFQDQDGSNELLAEEVFPLPGNALVVQDLAVLLGVDTGGGGDFNFVQGFLELELNGGRVGVFQQEATVVPIVTYSGGEDRFLSSLPLLVEGQTETRFLQIAEDNNTPIFTGLAIYNNNTEAAQVTVEAFAANGTLSAVKDLLLEPRSRVVGLLDNSVYFGGTFQQNGGYLRVTSSIPVGSYALFGGNNKDNEQYLSAIEGQKPLQ